MKAVKLLHAKWVMEAFNHMTSSIEKDICLKGWNQSGIQEALENGLEDNLDPFKDIDPIETADEVRKNLFVINKLYNRIYMTVIWIRKMTMVISLMHFLRMMKETIRQDTNSLSLCLQ